jgi:uncharacterized protein YkwD
MKNTFQLKAGAKLAVALSLAATLAACGGGSSAPAAPQVPQNPVVPADGSGIPPKTSVPASTYDAAGAQAAAFKLLNDYRGAMGVGLVAQDTKLDDAATKHATYLFTGLAGGTLTALTHDEVAGNPNYYADTPLARAQKSGVATTEYVSEEIAVTGQTTAATAAQDCVNQWLASVYHLSGLTFNEETVGVGFYQGAGAGQGFACTLDFGTSTGVSGAPGANENSYSGGQQIPVGTVVSSPYANETGVLTAMRAEAPNPATDLATPGRPILVRVNAQNREVLTVTQFTLTDNNGATVPARILVPASAVAGSTATTTADPNNLLPNGSAILLPLAPLHPNATYTYTFSGARAGSAIPLVSKSFTTGAL